jgi:hypothetical protein
MIYCSHSETSKMTEYQKGVNKSLNQFQRCQSFMIFRKKQKNIFEIFSDFFCVTLSEQNF